MKNDIIKSLLIIFIITFYLPQLSKAQHKEKSVINAWLELGSLKFLPSDEDSGVGVNIVFKFQFNKLLTSLQYHNYIDREYAQGEFELFTRSNHYHAINFMGGITNKKCRVGHVSISSGFSFFSGVYNNGVTFFNIGLPIEATASINILSWLGVNIKVFTNVNKEHSLIGFGMDLQLGKLRDFNLKRFFRK